MLYVISPWLSMIEQYAWVWWMDIRAFLELTQGTQGAINPRKKYEIGGYPYNFLKKLVEGSGYLVNQKFHFLTSGQRRSKLPVLLR